MNLFVYGTLLRGAVQGGLLAHLSRSEARIEGKMFRMPAGYPSLSLDKGGMVYGELIADIPERMMVLLDRYEGVAEGLYERQEVDVLVGLLRQRAFVYVGVEPERRGGVYLPVGRWREAVRRGRR